MGEFALGQSVPRFEDPRLVRGGGRYVGDILLPGMAFGCVLRSPHAHAKIRAIDTSAAKAAPGVLAVLTGWDWQASGFGDLPVPGGFKRRDGSPIYRPPYPALVKDRVRWVGDYVAFVVAETLTQAQDAVELVEVDYEPLPAVVSTAAATPLDAPRVWDDCENNICFVMLQGDKAATDSAFASAAHVVKHRFVINRVTAMTMEPRGSIGEYNPADGRYTVHTTLQRAHPFRAELSQHVLKVPENKIRVIAGDIGGSFGMKSAVYNEVALVLWGAKVTGRPVKWISTRSEAFLGDAQARDNISEAELALDKNGTFLGLRVKTLAADEMGLDPAELRRRNYIPPAAMPFKTGLTFTYDSGEFEKSMDLALQLADVTGFAKRRAESKKCNKLRGLGFSNTIERAAAASFEGAEIRFDRSGTATIFSGSINQGQGHETVFKQLVCDRLGLAPSDVTYVQGDTELVFFGEGTGGSRSATLSGSAFLMATDKVVEKGKAIAAHVFKVDVNDVKFADGIFSNTKTNQTHTIKEIAKQAANPAKLPAAMEPGLLATAVYKAPVENFPNGSHVCEIEIDVETGEVEIVRYSVVDDVGTVMNPLLLHGQIHGGVAQGAGQILMEDVQFDKDGQLLTGSLMDYAVPRAETLCSMRVESNPVPTKTNPLGVKGAGEAGNVGALPAIANAIVDALSEFGVKHIEMPATPERVWRAMRNGKNQ